MGTHDCVVPYRLSDQAMIALTIDDKKISAPEDTTIIQAAAGAGIYIPHICFHPDLLPVDQQKPADAVYRGGERIANNMPDLRYEGCQLCVVEIEGEVGLHRACNTPVVEGMVVRTNSPQIEAFRRDRIMALVAKHPHACLICAQKEGCARFPCSLDIPEAERCCPRFGTCEFQSVVEYVGLKPETPRYVFEDLPIITNDPLFERNYNLCIGCTRCIRLCRDVLGVGALDFVFDGDGQIVLGTMDATLQESGCRFCTACVEVCPTGALIVKEALKGAQPAHDRQVSARPAVPPQKANLIDFTTENLRSVPELEGVYQLLDEEKTVIYIKGTMNLRQELAEQLEVHTTTRYYMYEVDPLYTKRESELLQHYIAQHGEMPKGNRELDDLF